MRRQDGKQDSGNRHATVRWRITYGRPEAIALQLHAKRGSLVADDISSFNALASLQKLSLNCTQLTGDISSMRALASLQELILPSTQVTGDISSWSALTSLQELLPRCTQVSGDISSLSPLTSL